MFTLWLRTADQLSGELLRLRPALLYLPADEAAAHPEAVRRCQEAGVPLAAAPAPDLHDRELPQLERDLVTLRELGVEEALAGNLGLLRRAAQLGLSGCGGTTA